MRRRDFFKGLTGAVVALAVKPLAGLLPKPAKPSISRIPGMMKQIPYDQTPRYPGRLSSPFPQRLHGKLEGWELESNGLLSRYGQTHFATYDADGRLKHSFLTYRLIDEEAGIIRATETLGAPFVPGDEIRLSSTTGAWKGLARSQAKRVTILKQSVKDIQV